MKWEKCGLIFAPDRKMPWMLTHACTPVLINRGDDIYRVFYAGRDDRNRSHVGFFDLLLREPFPVVRVSQQPVLAPGPLGNFDDHGIYPSSIVYHQGRYHLYTIGWNPGARAPLFYASIGLATSTDCEHFTRASSAPILARSEHDPCSVTGPFVLFDEGKWRMWYVSGYRWDELNGTPRSYYNIKHAESADGINWRRSGQVAIEHASADEKNIARPFILKDKDRYRAWYAYGSGHGYRIGYAESADGMRFDRQDHRAGIALSENGFDSEMIAHPFVVQHRGRWFMFYNGNQFGKDGIGLAVADNLEP